MTVVFADSSALVKLYVDEPGSAAIRRRERRGRFFVSSVARVEVPSAFWRKARAGEMDATDARMLTNKFEVDWYGQPGTEARFPLVAASSALMADAARLCESHALKALDAIQLASALAIPADEPVGIACYDQRLARAAEAEGLPVLTPG